MTTDNTASSFNTLTTLIILSQLSNASDINKAYTTAGYGLAALYSTENVDGYFDSCGTVEIESFLDDVRHSYTEYVQGLTGQVHLEQLEKIHSLAKTLYNKILTDLQNNIDYLASDTI